MSLSVHWVFVEFAYTLTFWFIFTELLGTIHFNVYICNGKPYVDFACSTGSCNYVVLTPSTLYFTTPNTSLFQGKWGSSSLFLFLLSSEKEVVCKSRQEFAVYHTEISSWCSYRKRALLWTICYSQAALPPSMLFPTQCLFLSWATLLSCFLDKVVQGHFSF